MRHCTESSIDLVFTSLKTLCHPFDHVIFEDTFVKLVQEIRSEAGEYVAVRQILPEWMVQSKSQVS